MLCNMALVWLMIVFSKWYITYLFEMIFWNYFHSLKKGLCWPSVREHFHFEFGSAQSAERFFVIPVSKWYITFISKWAMRSYFHFEMLYDFHLQMSRVKFSYTKLFSSGITNTIYWRKCTCYYYFSTQLFAQGLVPILALK